MKIGKSFGRVVVDMTAREAIRLGVALQQYGVRHNDSHEFDHGRDLEAAGRETAEWVMRHGGRREREALERQLMGGSDNEGA